MNIFKNRLAPLVIMQTLRKLHRQCMLVFIHTSIANGFARRQHDTR